MDLDFFRRLPKAELHCHIDGSLRIPTIMELAEAAKIELPSKDPEILKQYLSIGERIGSLEDYIDRQIDHYLSELREKLVDLNNHFAQVEQAQETILQGSSEQAIRQARVQWRNALKGVQDEAGDAWNMLLYFLTGLKDKGDLKLVEPQEPGSLYEQETQFIGEQIGKAEKRITAYLFRVESVIQLEDLKEANMLIHLYLAREMAKKIRKLSG